LTDSKKWHGLSPKIKPYGSLIVAVSKIRASLYRWTPSYNVGDVAANGCAREKTRSGYNTLSKYIVKARKQGRLSWDHIIDETRHSIADFLDSYVSPEKYVHKLLYQLGELHNHYEEEILYKWYKQPYYVEIWLEKNALVGTFRTFLEGKHVRLVPNRGYGSWTYAYENCRRLSE
jgi:hypothetical protein